MHYTCLSVGIGLICSHSSTTHLWSSESHTSDSINISSCFCSSQSRLFFLKNTYTPTEITDTPNPIANCNILFYKMNVLKSIRKLIRPLPPQYLKWWKKQKETVPRRHNMVWCHKTTELWPVEKYDEFWPPRS